MWDLFSIFNKKSSKKNATKRRVAILGGSFDPVHNGHTQIVRKLLERFDRVIVVPAKISPFKLERNAVESSDRLNMLKLALEGFAGVEISDYELKSGGISYSYLTAKHYTDEKSSLYYVIGSEMLKDLKKWKNFDELKKLTSFYLVPREGYAATKEQTDEYDRLGVKVKTADFSVGDISSAMIKVDIAFGRAELSVDERVYEYIKKYNLYGDYCYITQRYTEFGMKQERIEHTYRAIKEGIRLAKIHAINVESVVTALLMHDIGKNISKKDLIKKYGIPDFAIDEKLPEGCRHAVISGQIAKHCFGIKDDEIIKAIETHTTCAPFMSDLAKVVAIADYIEPSRNFDGIDEIRKAAETDLDICTEYMLKNMLEHLKGKNVYKITADACDYFRMINEQKNTY